MKLRVVAKDENGKDASLTLRKEGKIYLHGKEFEVDDERGKELLSKKNGEYPIVELVKDKKNKETSSESSENKED